MNPFRIVINLSSDNANPAPARDSARLSTTGLLNLFVVYAVWSATYLAIRVAVSPGGFPPFAMGAGRMAAAGLILVAFSLATRIRLRASFRELAIMAITGTLLWVGCNGLVMWAEQYANSGFTALMTTSTPIWTAFLDAVWSRRVPPLLLACSLLIGFCGLGVLLAPSLAHGQGVELASGIAILAAAVCWSLGSLIQTRYPVGLAAPAVSGYQHLFATLGFLALTLCFGEPFPRPSLTALAAWFYLTVFGSVFAFTSFITALRLLPLNIAMTYAYVNPLLALVLGWLILGEQITPWTLVGAILVVLGVVGVFRSQQREAWQQT